MPVNWEEVQRALGVTDRQLQAAENIERLEEESRKSKDEPSRWPVTEAAIETVKDVEKFGLRPAAAGLRYAVTGQEPTAEELPEPEGLGEREAALLPYLGPQALGLLASDFTGAFRQQAAKEGYTGNEIVSPLKPLGIAARTTKEMLAALAKMLTSGKEWKERPITNATMVLAPLIGGAKLAGKGLQAVKKGSPPKSSTAVEPPRPLLEVTPEKPLIPIETTETKGVPELQKVDLKVDPSPAEPKGTPIDWEYLERVIREGESPEAWIATLKEGRPLEPAKGPAGPEPLPPLKEPVIEDVPWNPPDKSSKLPWRKLPEGHHALADRELPPPVEWSDIARWGEKKGLSTDLGDPGKPVPRPRDATIDERLEVTASSTDRAPQIREEAGVYQLTKGQRERLIYLRKLFEEGKAGKRYPVESPDSARDLVWMAEPSTYPIHGLTRKLALRTIDKVLAGKQLSSAETATWDTIRKDYRKSQAYDEDVKGMKYVREERRKTAEEARAEAEELAEREAIRTPEKDIPDEPRLLDFGEAEEPFALEGQHAVRDVDVRRIIADAQSAYGTGAAGKLRSQLDALSKDKTTDPALVAKLKAAITQLSRGEEGALRLGKSPEDLATPTVTKPGYVEKGQRPSLLLREVPEATEGSRFEPGLLEPAERLYLKRVARRPARFTPAGEKPAQVAELARRVGRGELPTEEQAALWEKLQHNLRMESAMSPAMKSGEGFVNYLSERVYAPARDLIGKTMTPFENAAKALNPQSRSWLQDNGAAVFRGEHPSLPPDIAAYVDTVRRDVFGAFADTMKAMGKAGKQVAGLLKNYFPQFLTREAVEALRLGKGPMYEAMMKAVKTGNRMREEVLRREMKMASRRFGPVEMHRRVTWPDYVDVETPQGIARMRVIETDPARVIPEYIRGAAHRLSMIDAGFGDQAAMEQFIQRLRGMGKEDLVDIAKGVWDDMSQKPLPFASGKAAAAGRAGEALLRGNVLSMAFLSNFIQGPFAGWAATSTRMAGKAMFKTLEDSVRRRLGAKRDWHMEKLPEWDVIRQDTLTGSGYTQDLAEAFGRGEAERFALGISKGMLRPTLNLANRFLNRYGGILGVMDIKQTVQMWKAATTARARAAIAEHAFRMYELTPDRLTEMATKGITEANLAHAARAMAEKTNLWKPSGLYRGRFAETGLPRQIRAYGSFLHVTGSLAADSLAMARKGQYGMLIKVMLGTGIIGPEVMRAVNDLIRDRPTPGITDEEGNLRWGETAARIAGDILRSGNLHYWTLILDPIYGHYVYGKPWTEGLVDVPVLGAAATLTEAGIKMATGTPVPEASMGAARKINPALAVVERQMSRPQGVVPDLGRAVGLDDVQRWTQGVRSDYLLTTKGEPRNADYIKDEAAHYRQELEESSTDWRRILADQMARTEIGQKGEPKVPWEEFRDERAELDPLAVVAAWKKWAYPKTVEVEQ